MAETKQERFPDYPIFKGLHLAVAVGGVLIVMKQRKGLHSKKSDNGIFIYAYSKKV